jgi:hypothetical protein
VFINLDQDSLASSGNMSEVGSSQPPKLTQKQFSQKSENQIEEIYSSEEEESISIIPTSGSANLKVHPSQPKLSAVIDVEMKNQSERSPKKLMS